MDKKFFERCILGTFDGAYAELPLNYVLWGQIKGANEGVYKE
jgi:hypothetical protein